MMQLAMDYATEQTWAIPDARADARQAIETWGGQFRPGFALWLEHNWAIWRRFEQEALAIAIRREHYSARTIFEYIRHETNLREGAEFKVNNNHAPDCARLFAALHPASKELFEFRGRE